MHQGQLWREGESWAEWGEGGAERWEVGMVPMEEDIVSAGLG